VWMVLASGLATWPVAGSASRWTRGANGWTSKASARSLSPTGWFWSSTQPKAQGREELKILRVSLHAATARSIDRRPRRPRDQESGAAFVRT
jgi:hypothetical protein